MPTRKTMLATTAAATMLVMGAAARPALADSASTTVTLQGTVPVICRYEMTSSVAAVQEGVADFGPVQQFCNSGRGYVFAVQHGPDFHGVFVMNGREVPASSSGTTILEQSSTPTSRTISLRVERMDAGSAANLSLSMIANS